MTAGTLPVVSVRAPQVRSATLLVRIDPVEHARRQAAGLGAVPDMTALTLLLALPEGFPVPVASLSDPDRRAVGRLPAGAATVAGGMVVRHAVRPLRAVVATVRGTCSETSLMLAGRFAPFCARRVLTTVRPIMVETLIEYDFWGIGITLRSPDGSEETLVEPRPWMPKRHTPAGWRFVEQAYAEYLKKEQR